MESFDAQRRHICSTLSSTGPPTSWRAPAGQQGEQSGVPRGLCTLLLGEAVYAQDVLLCFFQGCSQSSLLFRSPPFCVHPLPLDMLQLFVNKGPLSHIPATGGSFTLTAVGWLSICVCSGRHSCFDVRGFGVLFKWEESSLDISLLHCG